MFFQSKKCYEKVGEATETALIVLAEKMNVTGIDLSKISKAEKAHACNDALRLQYDKVLSCGIIQVTCYDVYFVDDMVYC